MPTAVLKIQGSIGGFFDDFSFEDAFDFFTDNQDADSYEIVISSPGGSVSEGFAIANLIEAQTKPVKCIAYQCMSIATVIFLAGSERIVSPDAEFMIHNPWVGMVGGDADQLEQTAEDLRRIENKLIGYYNRKTGANEDDLREMMNKETFISPEELIKNGFATAILETAQLKRLPTYRKAVAYYKQSPKSEKMEDKKSILNDIKNTIKEALTPPAKALQLALADGRVMDIKTKDQEAKEGDPVAIENESPENGTYETVAGQILTIESGNITAIEEKEVEPVFNSADLKEFAAEIGEGLKSLGEKITNLESELSTLKESHESEILALKKGTSSTYVPPKSEKVDDTAVHGEVKTIEFNSANVARKIRERQNKSNK